MEGLFLQYMCAKFLLEPEEITTDNFYEICQISAEKAAKRPHGELDAAEAASKCGGATTAMNKKNTVFVGGKPGIWYQCNSRRQCAD